MRPLWVLGAGGHAKVVIATARAAGFGPISLADDTSARYDQLVLGIRVSATVAEIRERADALAVFAIGDNVTRYNYMRASRCEFATVVHPTAIVDPTVALGAGTVVFAGAVIQPDSRLGAHTIVNTASSIDHDCQIGDAVHIAPGARLAGNVTLHDGVFIGIGACVIPGLTIGEWTLIGAGAAVIEDVPTRTVAVGVPARTTTKRDR